ncbi:MAG: hypothetical protein PWP37_669 [Thermotogota bacterium]|nr:hypothetical protein [Thermotogota bacterium]MDK2864477.1 hypothetical protein [Thermotogota bacterium]HCZ06497.1 hypothetical protein [Thermotogota bacterium]
MKKNELTLFNRLDVLFLSIPLVVAFISLSLPKVADNSYVRVYINGRLVYEQPLEKDSVWRIESGGKYMSTLVVDGEKRRVRLVDSDCPLKICERTGWVGSGGIIVCVPNRIVVKVEGKEKSKEIDIVTW